VLGRYANGFDSGASADFHTRPEAEQALHYAEATFAFYREGVAQQEREEA
jgi:hypothetical protein